MFAVEDAPEPLPEADAGIDWLALVPVGILLVGVLALLGVKLDLPELARRTVRVVPRRSQRPEKRSTAPAGPSLVDRRDELASTVKRLSQRGAAIGLTGAPGVGKSAIAIAAAHELNRSRGVDLADTIWIDAQGLSFTMDDLSRNLAQYFDKPALSSASATERGAALRRQLIESEVFLVVDNLPSPESDEELDLVRFLAQLPSNARVLVAWTGRPQTELTDIDVEELGAEDSLQLLRTEAVDRSADALVQMLDNEPNVIEPLFLERIGGNPQAIRWFVGLCKSGPQAPIQALQDLAKPGTQAPEQLFGVRWERTNRTHRKILRVIALHYNALPLVRIHELAGQLGRTATAEALKWLVEAALVERSDGNPPTFGVSTLCRQYVLSTTAEATLSSDARRLAIAYALRLESNWEDAGGFAPEIEDILNLLRFCGEHEGCPEVLRLFRSVYDILFTLGLFDDRVSSGKTAIACAAKLDRPADGALACSVVSSTLVLRGDFELAEKFLVEGDRLARSAADDAAIVYQHRCRAFALYRDGQIDEAWERLQQTLDVADRASDVHGAIDIVSLMTSIALHRNELDRSDELSADMLRRCEAANWERAIAYPKRDQAEIALRNGNIESAKSLGLEALVIAEKFRDVRQLCRVHLTIGRVSLASKKPREARVDLTRSVEIARQFGIANEQAEAEAHLDLTGLFALRRRRQLFGNGEVPSRLTESPIGGD